ncbi:Clavaminate synthase-like protein [Crepidotus variabilis]|uniref:Clavaminate synthase-like protein n=1 Tax=Crepidotus variabilis TaxID=179855 RepID=A0A9P6ESJ1_9AGAR|nr:Clavaminate synthase-like protein [Crepidotus variabilis]
MTTLPIIDIAPFLNRDLADESNRAATSAALHKACVEYGFFYLRIEAFVDSSEPQELAQLARAFFDLPQENKDKLALKNQDYARGYAKLKENVTNGKADAHEGLDFYRPVLNPNKKKALWGENQWPTEIPQFRKKFEIWINKMKELGMIVMEAMSQGLGMTQDEWEELRAQVDDSFWVMRVIGYPSLPKDHDGISCGAHKDYGCLTFLYADPTPNALQVFLDRGGSEKGTWINADPIPGCIVCNIGEMWEIWTNGLYRSTLHRVVHRGTNYRVSIPFFFEPNFDALVKPLPAVKRRVEAEESLSKRVRRPVKYGEFLMSKVGNNFEKGDASGRYGTISKL